MSQLIERLKEGFVDAQKRQAEVGERWKAVQAEWNAVSTEVSGYAKVIELETKRELERAATLPPVEGPPTQAEQRIDQDANQTQLVRDALANHPGGLTPAQVWGAVKGKVTKRTYVYSILKRLKDRKQVVEKRGKYCLPPTPKVEEGVEQTPTLQ
jgi:hypothetical protein